MKFQSQQNLKNSTYELIKRTTKDIPQVPTTVQQVHRAISRCKYYAKK